MRRIGLVITIAFAMITISAATVSAHYKASNGGSVAVNNVTDNTSVTPNSDCEGTRRPDIIPQANVWKHVGFVHKWRILNFWTNSPGHSQQSYKVKVNKDVDIDVLGGGSLWTFPCRIGRNQNYATNPLPGRTVAWLKDQGLARRHQ